MKTVRVSAVFSLVCAVSLVAGASAFAADYVDERAVLNNISTEMQKLLKDGALGDTKALYSQLQTNKNCKVTLPPPSVEELSPAALYEKNKRAVLMIASLFKCGKCKKWHCGASSGIVITADGVALTNYHVINSKSNDPLAAVTYDGTIYPIREILAANREDDVAVIKLEGTNFTHVSITTNAPIGTGIWVISHPGKNLYYFSEGMVSSYFTSTCSCEAHKPSRWMSITADYGQGSSGGPVFDKCGNVVGMVSATSAVIAESEKRGGHEHEYAQMVVKQCVPAEAILRLFQ